MKHRRKITVRAFDLILTFDSNLNDEELEIETFRLMDEINDLLQKKYPRELPQLNFDSQKGKKKIKLGVTVNTDEE